MHNGGNSVHKRRQAMLMTHRAWRHLLAHAYNQLAAAPQLWQLCPILSFLLYARSLRVAASASAAASSSSLISLNEELSALRGVMAAH